MAARWSYFWRFLRAPGVIGAVTPSSQHAARAMADQVDFARARVVVEYGPGTGVITRELLRRLRPDARLVAIELHPEFHAQLAASLDDPRVSVIHGSAEDVAAHLAALGLDAPDAVVSAIPFAALPKPLRTTLLERTRAVLRPGAPFVAIQYLPFALLPLLRRQFGRAGIARYVLRNVPPAFIMVAADGPLPARPSALREARGIIAAVGGISLGLALLRRRLGLLAALSIPLLLALYRDPHRAPSGTPPPGAVLAPGEGTVVTVGRGTDSNGAECQEIRIFLALWDVHVQRAPLAGRVTGRREQPGGYLPAFLSRAGDANQRTTLRIEGEAATCEVVQVAGILARRIVSWVGVGDEVARGQRIGMIKFGSQVVLRLPPRARILVQAGRHVRAGEDVVALIAPD